MPAAKEIRIKINSIKNTQKITRAMEMVAASKIIKAQDRMLKAQPYSKKILQVISNVAKGKIEYRHPYLQARTIYKVGYIIVTTDRGLCGSLNSNLLKSVLKHMQNFREQNIDFSMSLLGSKGLNFFRRFGGNIIGHVSNLGDAPTVTDLIGITNIMLNAYLANEIDALYFCFNEFVNKMRYEPLIQQILPLVSEHEQQSSEYWDYIYEPDEAQFLLNKLLTRYIESQVYRGVIENVACEQAARMLAMKNATDNAKDLINELNLIYHKARQANITQELSEIVAGASVL